MKKTIVGILISIGGLYLAFRNMDVTELSGALAGTNYSWIIFSIILMVVSVWIRAARWQLLLEPSQHVQIPPLYRSTMIGYFGNSVLPLRLGEFLRAYAVNRENSNVKPAVAFGTILIERLLDMLGMLLLTVILFFISDLPPWLVKGGQILTVVIGIGIIIIIWLTKSKESLKGKLDSISFLQSGFGLKLNNLFYSLSEGLVTLSHTPRLGLIGIYSLILWLMYWSITYSCVLAVGSELSIIQAGIILVGVTLVISVPSAPGFIGTYHAASVLIMSDFLGEPEAMSQAFSILNHAVGFVPFTLIGLYYFLKSSLKLNEVKRTNMTENLEIP